MFAMTTQMAAEAIKAQDAHNAKEAGHRRNGSGTWSHEAYVDPTYNEIYCKHCEEYLGNAN